MKRIFIEGTTNDNNGNLRQAFQKLFQKELFGNMPKIIMGDGKVETIKKFLTRPLDINEQRYLLIDSDKEVETERDTYIGLIVNKFNNQITNKLCHCNDENSFLMIQEAEAWILSQKEIIEKHYKTAVFNSRPVHSDVKKINSPSSFLSDTLKNKKLSYHKVRDFCEILPQLDTDKLKECFEDFKCLIIELKKQP